MTTGPTVNDSSFVLIGPRTRHSSLSNSVHEFHTFFAKFKTDLTKDECAPTSLHTSENYLLTCETPTTLSSYQPIKTSDRPSSNARNTPNAHLMTTSMMRQRTADSHLQMRPTVSMLSPNKYNSSLRMKHTPCPETNGRTSPAHLLSRTLLPTFTLPPRSTKTLGNPGRSFQSVVVSPTALDDGSIRNCNPYAGNYHPSFQVHLI